MTEETHETPNEDDEGFMEPWLEVAWRVTRLDDGFPGGIYVEDWGDTLAIREIGRAESGATIEMPYDEVPLLIEALQAALKRHKETTT